MPKRRVFYSFHYDNDCWRVQQIRHMGLFDEDEPVTPNRWEEIKRSGEQSIKNWINNSIDTCSCLIVLIGSETASRPWVRYEIETAWKKRKGVAGIYIHNLQNQNGETCNIGIDPFSRISVSNGFYHTYLSSIVPYIEPSKFSPVADIKNKIEKLVEEAIIIRQRHP